MPAILPNTVRTVVIQQWLQGKPRNDIATESGISSGAVTNIVNELRYNLGLAELIAERISSNDEKSWHYCGSMCFGICIATLMLRIGVQGRGFQSFILDVYNRCKNIGLSPENICSYLADLLEFSKTVSLSKIPDYIKEKKNEKVKLEEEIENLEVLIGTLREQKEDAVFFAI